MAAKVSQWTKVAIALQSALAAAITISAITKANPGVVSYTGADPANGDYVLITAQGMHQIDGRVVRVANVNGAGNTFELEGINTTAYDTFTSGTFEVITFGTTLTTTLSLQGSGGDFEMEDTTTVHDDRRTQVPSVSSAATYSMDHIWDVSDAGLLALAAASDNKTKLAMRLAFSNNQKVVFTGYVGCTLLPGGSAPGKVTTPAVITMHGRPTTYAT